MKYEGYKMKLDESSIIKICNQSKTVMVYGLSECRYGCVAKALTSLNYEVYVAENYPNTIAYDDENSSNDDEHLSNKEFANKKKFKAALTGLLIENYKKEKLGQAIIPLIFCVGIETFEKSMMIDISDIINGRGDFSHFTNSEIGRAHKIYSEINLGLQSITDKTLVFVKVKQLTDELFSLERVQAPWHQETWKQLWQERCSRIGSTAKPISNLKSPAKEKYNWRKIIKLEITLFRPADTKSDHDKLELYPMANQLKK